MKITANKEKKLVIVQGEIVLDNCAEFQEQLIGLDFDSDFYIDCRKVNFVDSAGLGSLITIKKHYAEKDLRLFLILSPILHELFDTSNLIKYFELSQQRK